MLAKLRWSNRLQRWLSPDPLGRIVMARPASTFAIIDDTHSCDELAQLWKCHPNHYTRMRAHAVLLSSQGYEVKNLVDIFGVNKDSVRSWIARFQKGGVDALLDADKPGGPRILTDDDLQVLKELLQCYPNRPAAVIAKLEKETGKQISRSSLRNYARRLRLSWKRFRRSLRKKRDEKAFQVAREELAELLEEPSLDVVYFDESGFSLKGVIPYGWQPIGERVEIPVTGAHGANIQVLGFEHPDGSADTYLEKGYVNTDTVIQIMDDYCERITQTTVVVLDNASCHTSAAFNACLDRWAARGLLIYHLPPYSPELNAIELLWKKLKYQLLPIKAWERFSTLLTTLTKTLSEIGEVTYMPSLERYAE